MFERRSLDPLRRAAPSAALMEINAGERNGPQFPEAAATRGCMLQQLGCYPGGHRLGQKFLEGGCCREGKSRGRGIHAALSTPLTFPKIPWHLSDSQRSP